MTVKKNVTKSVMASGNPLRLPPRDLVGEQRALEAWWLQVLNERDPSYTYTIRRQHDLSHTGRFNVCEFMVEGERRFGITDEVERTPDFDQQPVCEDGKPWFTDSREEAEAKATHLGQMYPWWG